MDPIYNIIALIVNTLLGGGIITIITWKDKKLGAALDNLTKFAETMTKMSEHTNNEWQDIANEWRAECKEQKEYNNRQELRSQEMMNEIASYHKQIDALNAEKAIADTLRCEDLTCQRRIPPYVIHTYDSDTDASGGGEESLC